MAMEVRNLQLGNSCVPAIRRGKQHFPKSNTQISLPKFLRRQESAEQNTIHHKQRYQIRPAHGLSLDNVCAVRPGYDRHQVIIQEMQHHRHPDIFCFHIGVGEEDPQRDTGNLLSRRADQAGSRAVIKEVHRQMPEPPDHAQKDHAPPLSETGLQQRLQIIPPSIFLPEKRDKY